MTRPESPPGLHDARALRALLEAAYTVKPTATPQSSGAFLACLLPLLEALEWRGDPRDVAEALPHAAPQIELGQTLNTLARLGFPGKRVRFSRGGLDPRILPGLLVQPDGRPVIVLPGAGHGQLKLVTAGRHEPVDIAAEQVRGQLYCFKPLEKQPVEPSDWLKSLLGRFRPDLRRLAGVSWVLNGFALAGSMFMMVIYDKIIPARSETTLLLLGAGACGMLMLDFALRDVRAKIWAHVAARLQFLIGAESLAKLLAQPPAALDNAPVGVQFTRLREFDSLREAITGPLGQVLLEAPFSLFLLVMIWLIAGPVVAVPLAMLVLYAALAWLTAPTLRSQQVAAGRARADRHAILSDILQNFRTIKQLALEERWAARFRDAAALSATAQYHLARTAQAVNAASSAVLTLAAAAIVTWSTLRVVEGAMSIGAMIAVMALAWRLLMPMQSLFLAASDLERLRASHRHLNQLMRTAAEPRRPREHRNWAVPIRGHVAIDRATFRYRGGAEPALLNVSFQAKPGAVVAVTGPNGAGKSTLLSLLMAMNRPQVGGIQLDGRDLRQFDPVQLRRAIGYVPQQPALFHGTIAQNLRMGDILASDAQLEEACNRIGILGAVLSAPNGFRTRLFEQEQCGLSAGVRQSLAIARALIKRPRLLLLDESAQLLDQAGNAAFERLLRSLRGETTTFFVSHRPSHIALADAVLVLERGQLLAAGPPERVLPMFANAAHRRGDAA